MKKDIRAIKEEIFAVVVLIFALLMVYTSMEVSRAANTDNAELYQNITNGTLDLALENTNVSFGDVSAGTAANSTVNFNNVDITDYRGTGAGWSATSTGAIDNFVDTVDANTQITLTDSMRWSPGDVSAVNGSSLTGVSAGTDDEYLDGAENLVTATAGNGLGAYQVDNTVLNFELEAGDLVGTYSTTLILTVS